jgi:hypothetical protein
MNEGDHLLCRQPYGFNSCVSMDVVLAYDNQKYVENRVYQFYNDVTVCVTDDSTLSFP